MESGRAIANVIFGDVAPSGKLPLTFPKRLTDSPAHSKKGTRTYPGDSHHRVFYDEGINVGYRYFDAMNIEPQFPFGFGMSYTNFEYRNLHLHKMKMKSMKDQLIVSVDVTNTGQLRGSEVLQVYANHGKSEVQRPPKELVGFQKILLNPEITRSVAIPIQARDLAFYDVRKQDWRISSGEVELLVGNSSRCEFLSETIVCYED